MKKLAIVTFNDAYNYGAFLQEYALQNALISKGYDVNVINYFNKKFRLQYDFNCSFKHQQGLKNKIKLILKFILKFKMMLNRLKKNKSFREIIRNEIIYSFQVNDSNLKSINDCYDYYISGSDQVWNIHITSKNKFYLLDFVKDNNKKISYAGSFGRSNFNDEDSKLIIDELKQFKSLLVREVEGQKFLSKYGIESNVVLDPTFLLTADKWREFADKSVVENVNKNYILIYLIAPQTNLIDAAVKYADDNNCEIYVMGKLNKKLFKGHKIKCLETASPYDFINYIVNANCVFTTSFHGMILSINLNKEFYYELSKKKENNNSRLINIANIFGLTHREIVDSNYSKEVIDWTRTNEIKEVEVEKSLNLLLKSIEE